MIVTIDFETYWSADYSLSKISEVDYILNPLYQTIMCSVKLGDKPADVWIGDEAVTDAFARIGRDVGWDRVALCSHNMRFDGAIAAWHYRVIPKLYLCTLGMARALTHIKAGGSSLDKVSKYLGLPPKGHEVVQARGKRLEDFGADIVSYGAYCLRDVENCYEIYKILKPSFPNHEVLVSDFTTRMFVQPQVKLNQDRLTDHLIKVRAERQKAFDLVSNIDRSVFSSNVKFAALLRSNNVEVPTKLSPRTNEEIPALAKNDRGFKELCDDDEQPPYVQALLAARVGAKSTLEETRTSTLLGLSNRKWGDGNTGWCPIPLKYYGAHTGRHSGDGGFNFLNFKRGSPIRGAITAPEGYRIVHRDSSQIEARMVAFLAGCGDLLDAFAAGRDVYSEFATGVYGRPVTKANVQDRFVGKTCVGEGTLVVTDKGPVPIQDVTTSHKVWDGIEWVSHDGLLAKGQQETLTVSGVSLTPDHGVWCGTQFLPAQSLVADTSGRSLRSALSAANLPSLDMCGPSTVGSRPSWCSVPADAPSMSWTAPTSKRSAAPDAIRAPSWHRPANDTGSMPTRCPTTRTAPGYSTASRPRSRDATLPPVASMTAMADAALAFTLLGELTARLSCATSKLVQGGMTRLSIWTGKATTAIMNRATSGSSAPRSTCLTSGASTTSKPASATLKPVYDLVNAGPRHRFTILTDDGPLIVSNCILGLGYGCGAFKFRHMLFIGNGGLSLKVELEEAERIVGIYREKYKPIPKVWGKAGKLLRRMIRGADPLKFPCEIPGVVTYDRDSIWLPNGMPLQYPGLVEEAVEQPDGTTKIELIYEGGPGRGRTKIYGAKTIENISQALARIVVTDAVNHIARDTGYYPFLTTYDSADYCVPEADAAAMDAHLERAFMVRPKWAPALPLASEGGWGKTLLDAERKVNQ